MRAFAFALAISLIATEATQAAAPARVASLNLCTDELLLAIAAPKQISSLSHLSRDQRESAYWRKARSYPANGGTILSVANDRPDLIVTMGGSGRDNARLAHAIGAQFLNLPFPSSVADVQRGVEMLAQALDRRHAGNMLNQRIERVLATAPTDRRNAVFVGSAGQSLSPLGAGAEWLAAAGYRQIPLSGDRINRETLLRAPALTLVVSNYRVDQYSRSDTLPVRRSRDNHVVTDGRRWTCMGPSLIAEVLRLRAMAAQ